MFKEMLRSCAEQRLQNFMSSRTTDVFSYGDNLGSVSRIKMLIDFSRKCSKSCVFCGLSINGAFYLARIDTRRPQIL